MVAAFSDPTGTIQANAASMGIPASDPTVAAAIASVQQTAMAEGFPAGSLESTTRISTLFNQFQGIYSKMSSDVAGAAQTALGAARAYVTQNHELSGAIGTTQGLVQAGVDMLSGASTPPQLAAEFSGPVIALMVGTGAVTAGVGAAIVGGIALAGALLDAAHVFPPPASFDVCPGFKVSTQPSFVIGCVAVYDPGAGPLAPGSPNWRSFPEPANRNDAWWFAQQTNSSPVSVGWKKAAWTVQKTALSARPIDDAFPEWQLAQKTFGDSLTMLGNAPAATVQQAWINQQVISSMLSPEQIATLTDFTKGFFQAWKANREYWLNGRVGADDVTVLQHYAGIWNRSHAPGQGIDVGPVPIVNLAGGPPTSFGTYWMTLIEGLSNAAATGVLSADKLHLHINTGPVLVAPTIPKTVAPPAPIHVSLFVPPKAHAVPVTAPVTPVTAPVLPLWHRAMPYVPVALGAAAFPFVGTLGPILGAAGTGLYLLAQRRGLVQ